MANDVLPIEGLPATIIKSDFCHPDVILSKSVKPVLNPVMSASFLNNSSSRVTASLINALTSLKPPFLGRFSMISCRRVSASASNFALSQPSGL